MTAREQFEALNYERSTHNVNIPKSQSLLIGQDEPHIEYVSYSAEIGKEVITFHLGQKFVSVYAIQYPERRQISAPLTADEIKAISAQMEELGWM